MMRLYSIGARWKNEYGALVECYWEDKSKYLEKNLSQCHSVHHKYHLDWPGIELWPPSLDDGEKPHEILD